MKPLPMKPHGERGMLITFCGLDGCGKTTQIRRLEAHLTSLGHAVVLTKQPTDWVRQSDIFRTYMDDPDHSAYEYRALSLFAAADRVQHAGSFILPLLREGKTVICDRYFYSCQANLWARGYEDDQWIYEIAAAVPRPDYAFFLSVPTATALQRVRARPEERDRYVDEPLQYRLETAYAEICRQNGGVAIDSTRAEEDTFSDILAAIGGCP